MPTPPYSEPLETSEHQAVSLRGPNRTYVYLASDEVGRLLYVGITSDVYKRLGQHAVSSPWYPDMAHVRTELYLTRLDAHRREEQLISTHNPPHNKMLRRKGRRDLRFAAAVARESRDVPRLIDTPPWV